MPSEFFWPGGSSSSKGDRSSPGSRNKTGWVGASHRCEHSREHRCGAGRPAGVPVQLPLGGAVHSLWRQSRAGLWGSGTVGGRQSRAAKSRGQWAPALLSTTVRPGASYWTSLTLQTELYRIVQIFSLLVCSPALEPPAFPALFTQSLRASKTLQTFLSKYYLSLQQNTGTWKTGSLVPSRGWLSCQHLDRTWSSRHPGA